MNELISQERMQQIFDFEKHTIKTLKQKYPKSLGAMLYAVSFDDSLLYIRVPLGLPCFDRFESPDYPGITFWIGAVNAYEKMLKITQKEVL